MEKDNSPKLFYGYKISAAGFVASIFLVGCQTCFGIFFKPMAAEFGWSRTEMSIASSILSVAIGISSFFMGRLTDRYGPRIVLIITGTCIGLGQILLSQVYALWQLYLFQGVIFAIGLSGAEVPIVSTIARWFVKRRGVMIGITKVGAGIGIMIIPPLASWLIGLYEWRMAYMIMGIIAMAAILPTGLLFKRDPAQIGAKPDNARNNDYSDNNEEAPAYSIRSALHYQQFWMFATVWCCLLYCMMSVNVHLVNHLTDIGINRQIASTVLTVYGGTSILGRILLTSLSDKIGPKNSYIISFLLLAFSFTWILFANDLWMFYLYGVAYGLSHGACFALLAPMAAWLFGVSYIGSILGTFILMGTIGAFIGPTMAGYIFDTRGDYTVAFIICALIAIAGVILLFCIRKIHREQYP